VEGKKAAGRVIRSRDEDEDLMEVEADLDGDALPTSPLPPTPNKPISCLSPRVFEKGLLCVA
jgi:hypothetical protein